MKKEKMQRAIAKNILNGTLNATAWVFEFITFTGALTVEAFLNPSYYANLPDIDYFYSKKEKNYFKKKKFKELTIRHSLWRLQKQGFVEKKNANYIMTGKGKQLMDYIQKRKESLHNKWDGKYRVVIFDIPEKEKDFRNWLRQELYILNYERLQKSVFVSKHSLSPDIIKEIKHKKMGNFVNYLLVEKIYKNIV
jgi:CRISPR-associated endonuclease Cas2